MDRNKDKIKIKQLQLQCLKDNSETMIITKYRKWMIFGHQVEDLLRIFIMIFDKIKVK